MGCYWGDIFERTCKFLVGGIDVEEVGDIIVGLNDSFFLNWDIFVVHPGI